MSLWLKGSLLSPTRCKIWALPAAHGLGLKAMTADRPSGLGQDLLSAVSRLNAGTTSGPVEALCKHAATPRHHTQPFCCRCCPAILVFRHFGAFQQPSSPFSWVQPLTGFMPPACPQLHIVAKQCSRRSSSRSVTHREHKPPQGAPSRPSAPWGGCVGCRPPRGHLHHTARRRLHRCSPGRPLSCGGRSRREHLGAFGHHPCHRQEAPSAGLPCRPCPPCLQGSSVFVTRLRLL